VPSSGNLAILSHQQVSGCDALDQLTCCNWSTDWDHQWPDSGARFTDIVFWRFV